MKKGWKIFLCFVYLALYLLGYNYLKDEGKSTTAYEWISVFIFAIGFFVVQIKSKNK